MINIFHLDFAKVVSNSADGVVIPVVEGESMNRDSKGDVSWEIVSNNRFPSLQKHHPFLEVEGTLVENGKEILLIQIGTERDLDPKHFR